MTGRVSRSWSALRTDGLSEIARVVGSAPAFIGLLAIFRYPPPSSMADIANDSLSARVDVHMLDRYVLFALAPFPRQCFDLHGVGAHEFGCQVAEHVQPFDAVTLVHVTCDAPRVRATNSSKAIFVTAMWAASIASISSFGRTPSMTARAALNATSSALPGLKPVILRMVLGRLP